MLFKDPSKYEGQTVPVVGERISNPDIARHISEATGKTVKCADLLLPTASVLCGSLQETTAVAGKDA